MSVHDFVHSFANIIILTICHTEALIGSLHYYSKANTPDILPFKTDNLKGMYAYVMEQPKTFCHFQSF